MELYTTVGFHIYDGNSAYYAVYNGDRILNLTDDEILIWQYIYGSIKTKEQIQNELIQCANTWDKYQSVLERLQYRNLIVCGSGDTEENAIYDLLKNLVVIPVERQFRLRLLLLIDFIINRIPVSVMVALFKNLSLTSRERSIYKWLKKHRLRVSDLIQFISVMEGNTAADGQENLLPVIDAIVGLYNKKWVYFKNS